METILVNVDSRKELSFFLDLVKKLRINARVLSREDKEDIALFNLMKEREHDVNLPVSSAYKILDKIIK